MCDKDRHTFVIDETMTDEQDVIGLRCECRQTVLQYVACPTCGAIRIDQRPAARLLVGLN